MVVRAGYGIFYDTLAVGDSLFLLGLNPPFVHFDVKNNGPSPAEIVAALKQDGVLINAIGRRSFRAVTHLDISGEGIEEAGRIFTAILTR